MTYIFAFKIPLESIRALRRALGRALGPGRPLEVPYHHGPLRERGGPIYIYIYITKHIYIYIYSYHMYVYIYIYIYRERERERHHGPLRERGGPSVWRTACAGVRSNRCFICEKQKQDLQISSNA